MSKTKKIISNATAKEKRVFPEKLGIEFVTLVEPAPNPNATAGADIFFTLDVKFDTVF